MLEITVSSVQSLSRVRLFVTPWTAAHQASPSITNSQSLLKLRSIESVMPSNHLILCCPLLLLPSIFPSIRGFSNESVLCIRWPKCLSFSCNSSLSNDYSGLIFFKIEWFDLLTVQGTLKCLLQHHSSKASVLPERIQIKISQRKKYRRQDIVGLQMWVFCCPFSVESGYLILGYQHVTM